MGVPETAQWVACDFETTGIHPGYHHRAVEIALVTGTGTTIEEEWSTLLCPDRDIGASDIHGLTGADLKDAPRFSDIAGTVIERIQGRTIIAHNANFDRAFMAAEMQRCGIDLPDERWICTLRRAMSAGATSGRLGDCCDFFEIQLNEAHSALADARACAELMICCARADDFVRENRASHEWPVLRATREAQPRANVRPAPRAILADLARSRSDRPSPVTADAAAYIELLDRFLEDRAVTAAELEELRACADLLGLSASQMHDLHADYLASLWRRSNADDRITDRELADLSRVSALFGIDVSEVERRTPQEGTSHTQPGSLIGKRVCFTGALTCEYMGQPISRTLADQLARDAGLLPQPSFTKKLDLLVVADPDSLSGKARKARENGTRIVAETQFWTLIDVRVD